MEYDFCSKCGNKYKEDDIPITESGCRTLHRLDFTLINGSIVCRKCWEKTGQGYKYDPM